jgi:hypothetical protein
MLLEGTPCTAVRVVRSAGYWVGSVVGGGRFVGTWTITRRFLASFFWRLEFSSVGRFFLLSFVHSLKILSRWAGWLLCCGSRGWLLCTRGRGRAQKLRHAQKHRLSSRSNSEHVHIHSQQPNLVSRVGPPPNHKPQICSRSCLAAPPSFCQDANISFFGNISQPKPVFRLRLAPPGDPKQKANFLSEKKRRVPVMRACCKSLPC